MKDSLPNTQQGTTGPAQLSCRTGLQGECRGEEGAARRAAAGFPESCPLLRELPSPPQPAQRLVGQLLPHTQYFFPTKEPAMYTTLNSCTQHSDPLLGAVTRHGPWGRRKQGLQWPPCLRTVQHKAEDTSPLYPDSRLSAASWVGTELSPRAPCGNCQDSC